MTAGLDLAAMPERTALASIEWAGTRAASLGLTCPPGDDDLAAAATEGWIAIPNAPISRLI